MDRSKEPPIKHLSAFALVELNEWLVDIANTTIFEVHGFFCAAICCPKEMPFTTCLSAILSNLIADDKAQPYLAMMNQLHTEIILQFGHYEAVYPLTDHQTASPFEADRLSSSQRENLSLWCRGYLSGIKVNENNWQSLKNFNSLKLALRIVENKAEATQLLNIDHIIPAHSSQANKIMIDMIESLPVLLGMIYDQACESADTPKMNKKLKKTDIHLLYHYHPNRMRYSQPNFEEDTLITKH